jgi:hypothetical protein
MHSHSREAGFTLLWWIQGKNLCYLNCCGVDKQQQKGPSSGALWLNISFLYPNSIPWFISVCGAVRLIDSLSLIQSLIFERVNGGPVSVVPG